MSSNPAGPPACPAHRSAVQRNLGWFRDSGILWPADGFWGVAERLLLTDGNPSLARVRQSFIYERQVADGVISLEHRRPDCNLQTSLAFDLAAEVLAEPRHAGTAEAILAFLFERSGTWNRDPASPMHGLWEWARPHRLQVYWTDDLAWVITILSILGRRGRRRCAEAAISTARAFLPHIIEFLDHQQACSGGDEFRKYDRYGGGSMAGFMMDPHWMGLVTMAFAHAQAVDPGTDYTGAILPYYRRWLPAGPAAWNKAARAAARRHPWSLSEYAYLSLAASVCSHALPQPEIAAAARGAADILLAEQLPDGHFPAEHGESPAAPHLADLIYTQNWATLGLLHAAKRFDDPRCLAAADRSLAFLASIQDRSPAPHFAGCWRGLYDTASGTWGGGDFYEGGASSIYSGWTNAPICLAFLLRISGLDLFPAATGKDPD